MREQRGASQILHGFLPGQTVDLKSRIWKVKQWREPISVPVDQEILRRALLKAAAPWADGRDGGFAQDLHRGYGVALLRVNPEVGVIVEPYPRLWTCQRCKRVEKREDATCKCGIRNWRQLHFVGYHDCGALKEPHAPPCPTQ